MSSIFEEWFWGPNKGVEYRRFDKAWVSYDVIQSYRVVSIFMFIGVLVAGFFYDVGIIDQFIFFTTWISYLSFVSLILNYLAAEDQHENPGKVTGNQELLWKSALITSQVSLASDFVVTIVYWTLLFDGTFSPTLKFWYDVFSHGYPLLINLLDFALSKFIWRIQHFVAFLALALTYGAYSYFYQAVTGNPIYGFLDWSNFTFALIVMLAIIALGSIFWFIFYGISTTYETTITSSKQQYIEINYNHHPKVIEINGQRYIQVEQVHAITPLMV